MQSRSLLILISTLAVTASASPLRRRTCSGNGSATQPSVSVPSTSVSAGVTYTLPNSDGSTTLTGPGNATLKYIGVGHGLQNYSCASTGAVATSIGALAVLWEITELYPGSGPDALSAADWTGFTPRVLRTTPMPLNTAAGSPNSSSTSSSPTAAAAVDTNAPFPAPADLTVDGLAAPLKFLGHHYFDDTNVPTFDLSSGDLQNATTATGTSELFKGKRDEGISAPADADRGLDDAGAVDWLRLSDKGGSRGISLVYRVLTAGGDPSPCTESGQSQSVPYTAMYWMY